MKNLTRYKRGIAAIVIIFCTLLIECVFNYPAIRFGYEDIDISDSVVLEDDLYEVTYQPDRELYVKQIKLVGDYAKVTGYSIEVKEINEFGKETVGTYSDVTSTWFSEYYTNLNRKILFIHISLPKKKDSELRMVVLSNRFEWNKYRMLFVAFVLFALYCIFFEKRFIERIEWYVTLFTAVFGVLIIILAQPVLVSWDEQIHFQNVYEMASGKDVQWSAAARAIVDGSTPACNTKAEFAQLRKAMNEKGREIQYSTKQESIIPTYSKIAYIPMALFMKFGMLLQLPFTWIYMLGKVGNLLLYVIGMFFIIRITKKQKLLLVYVAMMPTVVFLASSYSYDTPLNICMIAGSVLWINEMLLKQERLDMSATIAIIVLFSVGCLSKAVYIPLLLLVLIIPCFLKLNARHKTLIIFGVCLIFILVALTFTLPLLSSAISGNLSYSGDLRGGDTSPIKQAISMLRHPLASIRLMLVSAVQLEAFVDYWNTTNYFIGNQIFLWFGSLGALPVAWNIVILPIFFLLMFYNDRREGAISELKAWQRIYGMIIFGGTVLLIWLSMYMSFTEVGETEIIGVQPRYFIPLVYLGAILFDSKKIRIEGSYVLISRIVLGSTLVAWIYAIYYLLLMNRLF